MSVTFAWKDNETILYVRPGKEGQARNRTEGKERHVTAGRRRGRTSRRSDFGASISRKRRVSALAKNTDRISIARGCPPDGRWAVTNQRAQPELHLQPQRSNQPSTLCDLEKKAAQSKSSSATSTSPRSTGKTTATASFAHQPVHASQGFLDGVHRGAATISTWRTGM